MNFLRLSMGKPTVRWVDPRPVSDPGENRLVVPQRVVEQMWVVWWGNWGHFGGQIGETARTCHFWPVSVCVSHSSVDGIGDAGAFWWVLAHESVGGSWAQCRIWMKIDRWLLGGLEADVGGSAGRLEPFWWSNMRNDADGPRFWEVLVWCFNFQFRALDINICSNLLDTTTTRSWVR